MNLMPPGYDAWALRGPDEPHQIGTEDGQTCGRYPEVTDDAPRGYKPQPCGGIMMLENDDETASCTICGASA